ncbi:outer membrane protein assembly factor BamB family protein [Fulvivirga marina]|nr:PQQ-binding-like beta-propeller repeat protein [Fulvivirga marina]
MPSADFGCAIELQCKISNCASMAVSDKEFMYIPMADGRIKMVDIDTLELKKEINLKDFAEIHRDKDDFGGMYLLLYENSIIIQLDEAIYLYEINKGNLSVLIELNDLFLIYDSFIFKNSLFVSLDKGNENVLLLIDLAEKSKRVEFKQGSFPKFILFEREHIFLTDDSNIVCRSITDGTVLWKTELASYGNYHDDVWESDEEGDITMYAVLVDNNLIVGVDKGKVISLSTKSGEVNWVASINAESAGVSLIYSEGDPYIYALANYLYEIDIKTGELKRSSNIDQALNEIKLDLGHLGISKSCLFIGTSIGTPALVVLEKNSFEIKNSHPLEDNCELYGYPAIMGRHLILMDFSKQLYIFAEN